ncbi:MAG: hypothetical protein ABJB74_08890 [Gemmatimonas sp.]
MACNNTPPQLEAYAEGALDPEHDATTLASIVHHLATCGDCQGEVARIGQFSASLRKQLPYHQASDVLRARVKSLAAHSATPETQVASVSHANSSVAFPEAKRSRQSLRSWKLFALAASALLALVSAHDFATHQPGGTNASVLDNQELVNAHIRSLMSDHLVDVPSSDRHTVKPWFEGKINFSPSVFDFAADSFPLAGGRLDYATGHAMAAVVFHSGQHAINLFVWPSDSADVPVSVTSRDGYNVATWRRSHLRYAAVSTLNTGSLARFAALYVARDSTTGAVQR